MPAAGRDTTQHPGCPLFDPRFQIDVGSAMYMSFLLVLNYALNRIHRPSCALPAVNFAALIA